MDTLIKTSFQVTDKQLDFIDRMAADEQRSRAGVLRVIIDAYIEHMYEQVAREIGFDSPTHPGSPHAVGG